ncbi:DUF6944 family repetitive protein [Bacillus canaveralius]|uniref:DUF6944 family repetitive protein n=1 Tax=Bacillus canaveralius TaxID=1403243 RepID=UPI000F77D4AB|nr:hypothetical protein [Bacillus canaveralius]RSK44048.1 hypothetical protein EJA13_20755 [Bacillus canaveralius]
MDNQTKEIFGSVIAAVGTIISAIVSTPSNFIKSDLQNDLDLIGNVLQAVGTALQADGQEEISLEKVGNEIQAIGNVIVIAGMAIDFEKVTEQKLIITGNWIQALGGAVALSDELEDNIAPGQSYNIIGNLLQSIGNSMQALGGIKDLEQKNKMYKHLKEHENGQLLKVSGSWIQATGAVLSSIGQFKEEQ